jgi:hypothetical protein
MERRRNWYLGLAVASTLVGVHCFPRVDRVALHDPRLTQEARRWLADAEDEVAIADVGLEEALNRQDEAKAFRSYVSRDVHPNWPRSAAASGARERLSALVERRLSLAQVEVDSARQRVALAQAFMVRAHAETAVRHDISTYDLTPMDDAVQRERRRFDQLQDRLEQERAAVDEATVQWWQAYGAYLQSGGANTVLWVWDE